jgi:hypothetical protein
MTYFEQSDIKVNKKIYTIMEELFDGVDDIPMDEVRKKNIQLLRAQEKSMKYQHFKTNNTDKKMSGYCVYPIHCVTFDGT